MNVSLIPATVTDRIAVINLLNILNLPSTDLPEPLDNFIIVKNADTVVGTCGLEIYGTVALLRSLAVVPDNQGRGFGDGLLQATLELAKEKGVHDVYLITTTAANFFAKRGFTQVKRSLVPVAIQNTTQFSLVCPASATVMNRLMV
ncbi:arsenic resistance N-acetyltransferase ArsN2 [Adhaeribacter radiodurans]|uniref:GNAT family N-acetyltransferase n=1 Tax=Adhaeribacter radiodurans TaxID=2745197 RepID=A0A7L7L2C9_9BACT|nr:arsenic resistance N-acetyltransferase ArsN2 [Adhaeribacter radiodurans]QMU26944.1 GNAT family N-acetyltransferase [Adhaeribacter radiodurans]